jgi:hypothetical protein
VTSHSIELRFDGRPGEFFSWHELQRTSTGLNNGAPPRAMTCLQILVQHALDPLRLHLGRAVKVNSGYRSEAVNQAVGGSKSSRHKTGEAADIVSPGLTSIELVEAILAAGIDFDQVIAYAPARGGHLHIGLRCGHPELHRHEILWAPATGGYEPFRSER